MGFVPPATITVLATCVPGAGVRSTGAVRRPGARVASLARGDPTRLPGAIVGITGPLAGFVNDTPATGVVPALPVAVPTAEPTGADPFVLALGATFGAATASTTPIGCRTSPVIYSAGGYRFADHVRVGLPLRLLPAVLTPPGIYLIREVCADGHQDHV